MMVKIGINGFGRIGRLVFRAGCERGDVEFVGVNAPDKTPEQLAHSLKYDTVHGRFPGTVTSDESALIVNGVRVPLLNSRKPSELPWGELGAEYVLECTGKFLTAESVQDHLDAGAQVVVLSGPSKDDTPMFVMGVNNEKITPDIKVLSNASCTTNCLAPLAKVINDSFGIVEGLMTTIHAATASQNIVDNFNKKNWRLARSCFDNIIPTSTGAAKAVGKVIPELKGKLTGMAMRVPCGDVSVVDLTCKLAKPATYEEICAAVKAAADGPMADQILYCDEEVVSQDFRTEPHTCVFDAKAGIALNDTFVKLVAWYDNEWGYSNKMLDLTKYVDTVRHPC
ncbi:MAG: type I glyceraldehyde-3-phosphate dehydrogenase [Oscillospiraceae bacterium]|nr:type I glyceraldehyde-3-phosphate dehydrogenase [Oscillospiraceae bacterium]